MHGQHLKYHMKMEITLVSRNYSLNMLTVLNALFHILQDLHYAVSKSDEVRVQRLLTGNIDLEWADVVSLQEAEAGRSGF